MTNDPVTKAAELPAWVTKVRPHQVVAVNHVMEAYEDGNDVVFLDGPTGTGKTLIAELIRRENAGNALYVCSDKALQDQFAKDYPYAKVLKGRANYPTQSNPNATAADCIAKRPVDPCFHCEDGHAGCPYQIAKREALGSELAVTNISYLLTEANYVGGFSGRDLVIVDEADTLESQLMSFVEYRVPIKYMQMARMEPPKKGARKATIIAWMDDFIQTFEPMAKAERDMKAQRGMKACVQATVRVMGELQRELKLRDDPDLDEDTGLWLRQYEKDNQFVMKPVKVSSMGTKFLWRHAPRWLVMSATLISSDEMADSLGLPYDYATVIVPSTFPPENRPVIMAPIADVTYKTIKEGEAVVDLSYAIQAILMHHPKDRILIHTVSYDLTEQIAYQLRRGGYRVPGRDIITYDSGRGRHGALDRFKATPGSVLLAPSMERGIDLPDDLCRVQVLAKVPYPSLGDRQVSARSRMGNEGATWYAVQTIRDVVQMCGRGVRHKDDYCTTYILDSQFATNLYRKHQMLFPGWFRAAIDTRRDLRWLRRPKT